MDYDSQNPPGENPVLSEELQTFASELARLQPRSDRLDRERLAFLAGQASVADARLNLAGPAQLRTQSRVWQAAFAAMSAVSPARARCCRA